MTKLYSIISSIGLLLSSVVHPAPQAPVIVRSPAVHLAATTTPPAPAGSAGIKTATKTPNVPSKPATTTHTPKKALMAVPVAVSAPVEASAAPSPALSVPASQSPAPSPEVLNAQTRAAVVNIMCTIGSSGSMNPISGSGVIVDSRGIILTNAHVAQFFLLKDYPTPNNVSCVVRTGSPARAQYTAELLYFPPAWIARNAKQITSSAPTGTGQDDYAFLRITGTTNPAGTLPASFPHLPMSARDPQTGDRMLLAAYPASFLQGVTLLTNLYQMSAYVSVGAVYIFDRADTWIDLFSIPGSVVSQSGSSGGAAVRASDGTLAGLIVTDTNATTTSGRDLRAVSLAHIDHSLYDEGMGGIVEILSGDAAQKAAQFNATTAPSLIQALKDAIK